MNQAESDEEKENGEKIGLIPANVSDLRMALTNTEEERKKHFGRLPFMASHASLFHTVHFAVKSCREIEKLDNIKKANQISRDIKRRVEKEEAKSAKESKKLQGPVKDLEPVLTTAYQEPILVVEDGEPLSGVEMQEPESSQKSRSLLKVGSLLEALGPSSPLEAEATGSGVEVREPDLLVNTQGSVEEEPMSSELRWEERDLAMETQATSAGVQEPDSMTELQTTSLPVGVQEPDSAGEAQPTGLLEEVQEAESVGEAQPTGIPEEVQEPDSDVEAQPTALPEEVQEPDSDVEAAATALPEEVQEPDSDVEAVPAALPEENQEPDSAVEAQPTGLLEEVQESDSAEQAQPKALPEEDQEPDSVVEAQPTGLVEEVQEAESTVEAEATSLLVEDQEPESTTEAQATTSPPEVQVPDLAMEAQVTNFPVEGQEPNSVMEAQATTLPVGKKGPDSAMEAETTNVPTRAQEPDLTVGVQKSGSVAEAKKLNIPVEEKATTSHDVVPKPSSAKDSSRPLVSKVFHKSKSVLHLAKSKSVIFKSPQKEEVGDLVPSDLFLYLALIESCLPLPVVTIQKLCITGNILCRIQYFTLRQQKKKQPPRPHPMRTTLHIPKLERIRDTDYVTFDSLKDLEWKLYKGLVKRKPKTTAVWKPPSFISGIRAVQPAKATEYIIPLIPKDWIIDDSLKFSGQIMPFLLEI